MADRDGAGRPVRLALGAAGDEAEIDESDFGALKIADDIGPDAGMEAPAMDEHEMHLLASHRADPAGRVLRREGIQKTIDVSDLVRRREGHSEPCRTGRNRGWPDRRDPQASLAEAAAHGNSSFRRSQNDRHDLG